MPRFMRSILRASMQIYGRKWANALFKKKKKSSILPHFLNKVGKCLYFETQFSQNRVKKNKKKFLEPYSGVLRTYGGILELELNELELHAIFFLFYL